MSEADAPSPDPLAPDASPAAEGPERSREAAQSYGADEPAVSSAGEPPEPAPVAPQPPPAPPPPPTPPPSPEPAAPPIPTRSLLGAVRDNLEAVAFALILALLLRHFCIEVFKIPTASMEPTLFGDNSPTHPESAGDRILVDKLAYLLSDPKRWDVIVFHYPLNWNRNFIKRVAVLPNETFEILSGDLWVGPRALAGQKALLRPARKPRNVRDQLYVPVWPAEDEETEGKRLVDWWRPDAVSTGEFRFVSTREIQFERGPSARTGEDAAGTVRYGYHPITDQTSRRQPRATTGHPVRDVRLRATVEARAPSEVEFTWRPGDGRQHSLRVTTPGRSSSVLRTKESEYPLAARLSIGGRTTVEFESVDGDVRATVDGKEERVVADELTLAEATRQADEGGPESQELSVTCRGGAMTLLDLRLDHDLHYHGPREAQGNVVPGRGETLTSGGDEYFMLGDNTTSSSDSRMWTAVGEKLKGGSEVWWDSGGNDEDTRLQQHTVNGKTVYSVTDIEGIRRTWTEDDIVRDEGGRQSKRISFVTRDRIVGRAFFALLFWPLDGATWKRVRFIH